MIWVFVLVRVIANPFSNVFQKVLGNRGAGAVAIIAGAHLLMALLAGPVLLVIRPTVGAGFWVNLIVCVVLAVAGNALIVAALKRSDLSVLGPINAYKAIVSVIPGIVLVGEVPRALGLVGMGLIVAGSYALIDRKSTGGWWLLAADRGVQLRVAGLVLSAIEAVYLKLAIRAGGAVTTFLWWAVLGCAVAGVGMLLAGGVGREWRVARTTWREYAMLALTTGLMQLSTLLTFNRLQVSYSLALFQLSTLLTVFLGWRVFREPHFCRRMAGAMVMVAGGVLIGWSK